MTDDKRDRLRDAMNGAQPGDMTKARLAVYSLFGLVVAAAVYSWIDGNDGWAIALGGIGLVGFALCVQMEVRLRQTFRDR